MRLATLASGLVIFIVVSGCGVKQDPPPQFSRSAFSGTGDLMAECMQYASQSYCEREIWGGNER